MARPQAAGSQRVLAVDPGLTRCGFAVVDMSAQRTGTFVHVQVSGSRAHEALEHRVLTIMEAADELMERFRPDVVAVERVFAQQNRATVMGTAQASGVAMLVAARRGWQWCWSAKTRRSPPPSPICSWRPTAATPPPSDGSNRRWPATGPPAWSGCQCVVQTWEIVHPRAAAAAWTGRRSRRTSSPVASRSPRSSSTACPSPASP